MARRREKEREKGQREEEEKIMTAFLDSLLIYFSIAVFMECFVTYVLHVEVAINIYRNMISLPEVQ